MIINEKGVLDQLLFIDITSRDEENGGWETKSKPLPQGV